MTIFFPVAAVYAATGNLMGLHGFFTRTAVISARYI